MDEKAKCFLINVLELTAIEYALKSFAKDVCNKHVKLFTDNT